MSENIFPLLVFDFGMSGASIMNAHIGLLFLKNEDFLKVKILKFNVESTCTI